MVVSQEIPATMGSQENRNSPSATQLLSVSTSIMVRVVATAISNTPVTSARGTTQCPSVVKRRTNQGRSPPNVRVTNTPIKAEV